MLGRPGGRDEICPGFTSRQQELHGEFLQNPAGPGVDLAMAREKRSLGEEWSNKEIYGDLMG